MSPGEVRTTSPTFGLVDGDSCKVAGLRGSWTFKRVVCDDEGTPLWCVVWGGRVGHEMARAFRPDRVQPIKVKKRKR